VTTQLTGDTMSLEIEDGNGTFGGTRSEQVALAVESQTDGGTRTSQTSNKRLWHVLRQHERVDQGEIHAENEIMLFVRLQWHDFDQIWRAWI